MRNSIHIYDNAVDVIVGREIAASVARSGISLPDLATRLGRHPQWLRRRVSGTASITVADVVEIANDLGVTPYTLLEPVLGLDSVAAS
jgi:transcriptional regulator with XRE-family HTH domain